MKNVIHKTMATTLSVLLAVLFAGNVFAGDKHSTASIDDIPNNANRIILEQEEQPAADMYVDAMQFLRDAGYEITKAEDAMETQSLNDLAENRPLTMNAEKKINKNMAVQITINVNTTPGGSELIASAYYADSKDVSEANWKEASWTQGKSKKAFEKAFTALRQGTYDTIAYETGVAVASQ
jgi:hypothetical protein